MEEALAPQTHDIATDREHGGDLVVGVTFGGKQDHLGAKHLEIRQRILTRADFQYLPFMPRETDREGAMSWHCWQTPLREE
jgi:hypothetical protein